MSDRKRTLPHVVVRHMVINSDDWGREHRWSWRCSLLLCPEGPGSRVRVQHRKYETALEAATKHLWEAHGVTTVAQLGRAELGKRIEVRDKRGTLDYVAHDLTDDGQVVDSLGVTTEPLGRWTEMVFDRPEACRVIEPSHYPGGTQGMQQLQEFLSGQNVTVVS